MRPSRALVVLLTAACAGGGEAPPDGGVAGQAVVRWEARGEQGIYGYLVYRAESRDGPFLRVSPEIVHVSEGPPGVARAYEFADHGVVRGRTYYYYLDTVGLDGVKRRFSGVVAKTVGAE